MKMLAVRFATRSDFNARDYLKNAWGLVQGEIVPVKVIFSQAAGRYIRDRLWHPSQKFTELADGRFQMSLRVADTLEVRRWILGYGSDAEVVEPWALREGLRQEVAALAAKLTSERKPPAKLPRKQGRGMAARHA
jgi:predicted DNA-binding transcriptional regulator YafY